MMVGLKRRELLAKEHLKMCKFPRIDGKYPTPLDIGPAKSLKEHFEIMAVSDAIYNRNTRNARLDQFYPDVCAADRLATRWEEQKTLREIEAHIVVLHLIENVLRLGGIPVFDLMQLRSLDAEDSLRDIAKCVVTLLKEGGPEMFRFIREWELLRVLRFIEYLSGSAFERSSLSIEHRALISSKLILSVTEGNEVRTYWNQLEKDGLPLIQQ